MGTHEHFGELDVRLRQALDYDDSGGTPSSTRAGMLWVPGSGKWTPRDVLLASDFGVAGGVAPLDSGAQVPAGNLPVGAGAAQVAAGNHTHDSRYVDFTSAQSVGGVKTFTTGVRLPTSDTNAAAPIRTDRIGAANGVAGLDSGGIVALSDLPVAASGASSATALVRADDTRLTRQVTQLRANANQAITAATTWFNVLFPVEDFDDEGLHSTSTNTDRITFVRPGRYRVGGSAMWTAGIAANGQRGMRLCVGGTQINGGQNLAPYLASNYCSHNVTPLFVTITQSQISAGTAYLQMQVYSSTASSGTPANLFGSAADGCVMTVEYVGP